MDSVPARRGRPWYRLARDIMAQQCQHWSALGGPFFVFPQIGLKSAPFTL